MRFCAFWGPRFWLQILLGCPKSDFVGTEKIESEGVETFLLKSSVLMEWNVEFFRIDYFCTV